MNFDVLSSLDSTEGLSTCALATCRFKFPLVEHDMKQVGQNQDPFTHLKTARFEQDPMFGELFFVEPRFQVESSHSARILRLGDWLPITT